MGNILHGCDCKPPEPAYMSVVFTGVASGQDQPQHVPYDRILSRKPADIWDDEAHEFVCRRSGAYQFTFTGRPDMECALSLHLMRGKPGPGEGDHVATIYSDKNVGNTSTSSQTAVLDMRVGERAWIRLDRGDNMGLRSHPKSPTATFNAVLVHPSVPPKGN